jgi:glycosyltransferase involved in cell wall biosynthesis
MLGTVVIGRNEGPRLRACLNSVRRVGSPVVYVDSGSTDQSCQIAREYNVDVVVLNADLPFSASRARHAGFEHLLSQWPACEFVFFIDGDCEVVGGWPEKGCELLRDMPKAAAVAGRRRECDPHRSWFNLECEWEWDRPAGEVAAIGGDGIYRVAAYRDAGGFNPTVAAGEEPELCARLRRKGWLIWRLDDEMTIHDAALARWRQWWRRQVRTGYGGFDVERRFRIRLFDRILRGAAFWSIAYPTFVLLASVAAAVCVGRFAVVCVLLLGVAGWLAQVVRIGLRERRGNWPWNDTLKIALLMMLAKFPITWGAAKACFGTARGVSARIVEYK